MIANTFDRIVQGILPQEDELVAFLNHLDTPEGKKLYNPLFYKARSVRNHHYGNSVYMRGLIEFTNYCKRNCSYCGLRRDNKNTQRYRLSPQSILSCCKEGYDLGYRTFVLQGGEDHFFDDHHLSDIVKSIKNHFPDAAVTLSVGEKSYSSYKLLKEAGADRYLLRHETANKSLYKTVHPDMNFESRQLCLYALKDLGYQVGAGFMVGLPGQTNVHLAEDLSFLYHLSPHMIGIGPFIPHKDTPLGNASGGAVEKTLLLLSLTRLLIPSCLLPSTTALGTLDPQGREKAFYAGANVIMPNLSPMNARKKYTLYNNKIHSGDEAAQALKNLEKRVLSAGCTINMGRGDHRKWRFDSCPYS